MTPEAEALRSFARSCRKVAGTPVDSHAAKQWQEGVNDGLRLAAQCADDIADTFDGQFTIDAVPGAILDRMDREIR